MKKLLFYSIFLLLAGWSLQSCEFSPGDDEDGGDPSNLGVYVVMEGNMSDNNGMLCYIDGEIAYMAESGEKIKAQLTERLAAL